MTVSLYHATKSSVLNTILEKKMARPRGFEPLTARFVAEYSIQLSYGRSKNGGEGGIRTLGTSIRYGSLAGNWFQPLTHLSAESAYITPTVLEIKVLFFNYIE
jgi:hypothetical protein